MFLPDGHDRTFGEMTSDEKHGLPPRGQGLSHRARAFMQLAEACLAPILDILDEQEIALVRDQDGDRGLLNRQRIAAGKPSKSISTVLGSIWVSVRSLKSLTPETPVKSKTSLPG